MRAPAWGRKLLVWAFLAFSVAVALGLALLAGQPRRAALVHGAMGLAGLALLAVSLWRGAPRGPFAWDALALASAAACGGALFHGLARAGRRAPALLIPLHATAGGLAYLLLAGFVFGR